MRTLTVKGQVWLHVDRFDKKHGDVWAVQYIGRTGKPVYRCFQFVDILIPMRTVCFSGTAEPRAFLAADHAKVYIKRDGWAMIGSAK